MAEGTLAYRSPTTSAPTMLTSSSAGLLRLFKDNVTYVATVVAGLIQPPPLAGSELSSSSLSSANLLQRLDSLSSSEGSSSSLVPTLPSLTMLQSHPGTKLFMGL